MIIRTITIILLIITEQELIAQQITENDRDFVKAIKIETGFLNYASIDEIYSQQVYSGTGFLTSIGFENRRKIMSFTNIGFSFFKRYPEGNKDNDYPVEIDNRLRVIKQIHFEVSSFHCFHLITLKNSLSVYAALNWFTSADLVTNYNMKPELLLSTLAPGFYSEYKWRRHLVHCSFTTSVLSYTCRSNYSNVIAQDFEKYDKWDFIKSNSRITGINSFQSVFLNFSYTYRLNNRFSMNAGYNFRYVHDANPRDLKIVKGIYQVGWIYKF